MKSPSVVPMSQASSERSIPWVSGRISIEDDRDEPPPYQAVEPETVSVRSNEAPRSNKELALPYVIPLSSPETGSTSLTTLAAVYASELEHHGISKARFIQFLRGFDEDQPGMLDQIVDMLEGQGSSSGRSEYRSMTSSSHSSKQAYIDHANQSTFHPASLHVEMIGSDASRTHPSSDSASAIEAERQAEIAKIGNKLARRNLKLEEKLVKDQLDDDADKADRKYAEKKAKAERKAREDMEKLERKTAEDRAKAEKKAREEAAEGARQSGSVEAGPSTGFARQLSAITAPDARWIVISKWPGA